MTQGTPLRVLITALGGEGGGVLMNWLVAAARAAGHAVQATSVPGVAQRTGSTSYYIEIAPRSLESPVLGLVPMPGRVDVLVSSELTETARVMAGGFVSPKLTTVISSASRTYSVAEKIALGDGRFGSKNIRNAVEGMAKNSILVDLNQLAKNHGTFVSATMFGALAASGTLPWGLEISRGLLGDPRSEAGFDAAVAAVERLGAEGDIKGSALKPTPPVQHIPNLPASANDVIAHGLARVTDFQDVTYGEQYLSRVRALADITDPGDHRQTHALTEASRRLALWMAYEDVARVADLKTRPERFQRVTDEIGLKPGQTVTITEFMKPRAEEIADILPQAIGRWIMARVGRGKGLPFLGRGIRVTSNGVFGYRLLRLIASLRHIRRRSYRFHYEQRAIEDWLASVRVSISASPEFAEGLAELPRVLKGYSDTLVRGKTAYARIMEVIVRPAIEEGREAESASTLRDAISAALADDSHAKLEAALTSTVDDPEVPNLKVAAHA